MNKIRDNVKEALGTLSPALKNQTVAPAAGLFAGAFGGGMNIVTGDFGPAFLYLAAAGCFYVHIVLSTTDW